MAVNDLLEGRLPFDGFSHPPTRFIAIEMLEWANVGKSWARAQRSRLVSSWRYEVCPRQWLRHNNDNKHDGIHVGIILGEQLTACGLKQEARLIIDEARRSTREVETGPRLLSVSIPAIVSINILLIKSSSNEVWYRWPLQSDRNGLDGTIRNEDIQYHHIQSYTSAAARRSLPDRR